MFLRIDHIGIVAPSFSEGFAIMVDQLGLELDEQRSPLPDGVFFAPEQSHAYFFTAGQGDTRVEMLVPKADATSGTARFLARRGPGLHHLAFACDDLDAEADRLLAAGLVEIDLPRTADGRRTASFFSPAGVGGILTELVTDRMEDMPGFADFDLTRPVGARVRFDCEGGMMHQTIDAHTGFIVREDLCTGCAMCVVSCTSIKHDLFSFSNDLAYVEVIPQRDEAFAVRFTNECDGCSYCLKFCAFDAIGRPDGWVRAPHLVEIGRRQRATDRAAPGG